MKGDLQLKKSGDSYEMIGFVELGEYHDMGQAAVSKSQSPFYL